MVAHDPEFFSGLADRQAPEYLWIGCSDSRVPANQIVGLAAGEVFVHRNVANVVVHTDLNCLSVLQYAVDVLGVRHVVVCGHYGCGGVRAALDGSRHGLIDNWLRHVMDVAEKHAAELASLPDDRRFDRLCELNIVEQVANVCQTTIVEDAWARGQDVVVHGLVYGLEDGLLRDLGVSKSAATATQSARPTV
jgi:carbonic anhydrase